MKTVVIGFADAAGKTEPQILAGLDVAPQEQMAGFAKAKNAHEFPKNIQRLELCELVTRNVAVYISEAKATLEKHRKIKAQNDAAEKERREKAQAAYDKQIKDGQRSRLSAAVAGQKSLQEQLDKARSEQDTARIARQLATQSPTKESTMKNGTLPPAGTPADEKTTVEKLVDTAKAAVQAVTKSTTLLLMLAALMFACAPQAVRAQNNRVYAPQSIGLPLMPANSISNNVFGFIDARYQRNVGFEWAIQGSGASTSTNYIVLTPTVGQSTNTWMTNLNTTFAVVLNGATQVKWGTNLDALGYAGWYISSVTNGGGVIVTNTFKYSIKINGS